MILLGDSSKILKDINDSSIDLIVTDPPYGIEFMGKDWDKALVPSETWKECYRILKTGKLAFIMCSPRQDVLSRMIVNLQDAGFRTNYSSIYWTFASGFPKAANVSKLLDKKGYENHRYTELSKELCNYLKTSREKLGLSQKDIARSFLSRTGGLTGCVWNWENGANIPTMEEWNKLKELLRLDDVKFIELIERAILKREEAERNKIPSTGNLHQNSLTHGWSMMKPKEEYLMSDNNAITEEAKKMEGAYVGFQPKPAVEIILVVSKGKTLTWLDDCRIPYQSEDDKFKTHVATGLAKDKFFTKGEPTTIVKEANEKGRFPANLLVSDDVLNDGHNYKVGDLDQWKKPRQFCISDKGSHYTKQGDEGSYSRYFSLDAWASTFPFIITPKASKQERNEGLDSIEPVKVNDGRNTPIDNPFQRGETLRTNSHPTVKPIKLMSYLITLGSREGDIILDPFMGSGTTCIAAHQLHRKFIGIEINSEYLKITKERLTPHIQQQRLVQFT